MRLTSPAIEEGGQIPIQYTKDGENIAPPLSWGDLPRKAEELALLFECTTPSTKEPFTQWLVYGLSPEREGLPEGMKHKRDPETPGEAVHGRNDIGNVGYDGPLGSAGKRMDYRFRLLALDRPLGLGPGAAPDAFDDAIKGHILDSASLICSHERPPA
jgi:hypothetical protein